MKHETFFTGLTAAVLAFFTAWGSANCLVTAFDLPLTGNLTAVCFFGAVISALLLSVPHGGKGLLCLAALAAGYIHRDGSALRQLWQLAHHLSTIYNRAYGCGILVLPETMEAITGFDWPVWIYAGLVSAAVCLSICGRKTVWLPMLAALLPLTSCIVVTDTVPSEHWLLMMMAGLILLLLTASVRKENGDHGLRLAAAGAVPVTAALVLLFLAFPQESYVNQNEQLQETFLTFIQDFPRQAERSLDRLAARFLGQTPSQLDLTQLGSRLDLRYPVLEVTAEYSGILYLRQQDFDRYDGQSWTATQNRQESFSPASGIREEIRMLTLNQKALRLLPYYPGGETRLQGGCLEEAPLETEYTLLRTHLPENWRQTAYGGQPGQGQWAACCGLPEETRHQAEKLLEGLYPETASNTEKADIIAALVTESAAYDLNPGILPEGEPDFALWFLLDGEKGYCVHFATAATVLLRAADIPARYVTGYMVEVQGGRPATVTEENAHAWAEYYEPNLNLWLPLEATPGSEEPPSEIPAAPEEPQASTLPSLPEESAPEASTLPEPTTPAPSSPPETAKPSPAPEDSRAIPVLPLLAIPLLALALAGQRRLRLSLRRKRQQTGPVNRQALWRWQESMVLSRLLKDSPAEALMALAQKAKFSQHELTAEELNQFDSFNRSCLRLLRKKPWYLRLIHQYIYAAY